MWEGDMRYALIFLLALTLLGWSAPVNQTRTQKRVATVSKVSPEGVKALDEVLQASKDFVEIHRRLSGYVRQLDMLYGKLDKKYLELLKLTKELDKALRSGMKSAASREFENRTQRLEGCQEMHKSFNLQYLMLQNKISHENRQFTMVSNILKNKHDTAKNAINNIR